MKSPITTHVLDTALGRPAKGVSISIEFSSDGVSFRELARGLTNDDGRITDLLEGDLQAGVYRMTFDTETYFKSQGVKGFYPFVPVVFRIEQEGEHYHVPLLLNPYGYSTYRGS